MQKLDLIFAWGKGEGELSLFDIVSVDYLLLNVSHRLHQSGLRSRQISFFVLVLLILGSIGRPPISLESKGIVRFPSLFINLEDGKGSTSIEPHHIAFKAAVICVKSL
jgi:hypothetical protein